MFKRLIAILVCITFIASYYRPVYAQDFSISQLPVPGTMVSLSPSFEPALIRGLTVHKDNPFLFDFIVDPGQSKMSKAELKDESERMIKYFFASLTIPDKDIWVNLSPYEKDRMVPASLGVTAMGRDLLAQDYMLKQLTASLIYPQKALGKTFWAKIYARAKEMYGTTKMPVNTFNKVWIVPQRVGIYEHGQTAFIVDGHLKVMLEEDYLALNKQTNKQTNPSLALSGLQQQATVHALGSQIIREVALPEIEKEVNNGKNFATLRQIFYAQALAVWFKRNLKQALLNHVYANKGTVKGIDQNDAATNEAIYHQYLKAYKKGVFNYIQEDKIPCSVGSNCGNQTIARKYFSGGYGKFEDAAIIAIMPSQKDKAIMAGEAIKDVDAAVLVESDKAQAAALEKNVDLAMLLTGDERHRTKIQFIRNLERPNMEELYQEGAAMDELQDKVIAKLNRRKLPFHGVGNNGALKILSVILDGELRPVSKQELNEMGFEASFPYGGNKIIFYFHQEFLEIEEPEHYGPDYVIIDPNILTQQVPNTRYKGELSMVPNQYISYYLVTDQGKKVRIREMLERAVPIGLITSNQVNEAMAKVLTYKEFMKRGMDGAMITPEQIKNNKVNPPYVAEQFSRDGAMTGKVEVKGEDEAMTAHVYVNPIIDSSWEDEELTAADGSKVSMSLAARRLKLSYDTRQVDIDLEKDDILGVVGPFIFVLRKDKLNVGYLVDVRYLRTAEEMQVIRMGAEELNQAADHGSFDPLHISTVNGLDSQGNLIFDGGKQVLNFQRLFGLMEKFYEGMKSVRNTGVVNEIARITESNRPSREGIKLLGRITPVLSYPGVLLKYKNGMLTFAVMAQSSHQREDVDFENDTTIVEIALGAADEYAAREFLDDQRTRSLVRYIVEQTKNNYFSGDTTTVLNKVTNILNQQVVAMPAFRGSSPRVMGQLSNGEIMEIGRPHEAEKRVVYKIGDRELIVYARGKDTTIYEGEDLIEKPLEGSGVDLYGLTFWVNQEGTLYGTNNSDKVAYYNDLALISNHKAEAASFSDKAMASWEENTREMGKYVSSNKGGQRRSNTYRKWQRQNDRERRKVEHQIAKEIKEKNRKGDNAVLSNGGIDLSQQDAAMHVTKDANGGVKVSVDPALIARVEREGMSEVDPVIIDMEPANIKSLFGALVKAPVGSPV